MAASACLVCVRGFRAGMGGLPGNIPGKTEKLPSFCTDHKGVYRTPTDDQAQKTQRLLGFKGFMEFPETLIWCRRRDLTRPARAARAR